MWVIYPAGLFKTIACLKFFDRLKCGDAEKWQRKGIQVAAGNEQQLEIDALLRRQPFKFFLRRIISFRLRLCPNRPAGQ
ncbi:hypothetical protein [Methylovirgula sp. 4M-Z18]|uniref:hypothetical protein n=1 Tax=Methylovirgula sp. 4M-Z18 TaxID=2293567 RepID=UPI001313EE1F|nr:hypothetical protein [Methylovirgula sp. 4M-Z18]